METCGIDYDDPPERYYIYTHILMIIPGKTDVRFEGFYQ